MVAETARRGANELHPMPLSTARSDHDGVLELAAMTQGQHPSIRSTASSWSLSASARERLMCSTSSARDGSVAGARLLLQPAAELSRVVAVGPNVLRDEHGLHEDAHAP